MKQSKSSSIYLVYFIIALHLNSILVRTETVAEGVRAVLTSITRYADGYVTCVLLATLTQERTPVSYWGGSVAPLRQTTDI